MLYLIIMSTLNLTTGAISSFDNLIPAKSRDILQKENWELFQEDIEERIRIYSDDWYDIVLAAIKTRLSVETQRQFFPLNLTPRWPIPKSLNLLREVIEQTSQVYNDNATRAYIEEKPEIEENIQEDINTEDEIPEDDFTSERYSDIVNSGFNATMQFVNRMTNLCNVVLVRPVPDPEQQFTTTGLRFDILTPDQFIPIQHPDDPKTLIGVIYTIDLTDTAGSTLTNTTTTTRKQIIIYMGTGEEGDDPFWAETNNNDNGEIEKQPYEWINDGVPYLPFAVFRSHEPPTGQFVNRTLGDGLVQGTIETANLLSRWIRAFEKATAGKQLLISGPGGDRMPKEVILDAMAIVTTQMPKDEVAIETIDHEVDINGLWEALFKYAESVISEYGITQEKFSGSAQSGVALMIKGEKLRARIENQWPSYRQSETNLAWLVRRENNRALPTNDFGTISDTAEFEMDFGDLPFEPDPIERVPNMLLLVDRNIMSSAEVLMKIDASIATIEDAQRRIIQNKVLNRQAQGGLDGLGTGLPTTLPPVTEEESIQVDSQQDILNDSPIGTEVEET